MTPNERENEERRAVEDLAQALCEAEDPDEAEAPGGIAWARRVQIVRGPWLVRARRQLRAAPVLS